MDLGLDVREQGDWTVLGVTGEIDIATAPSLREKLHSLLAEGRANLIIDLDDVTFLDSTALGVFTSAEKRQRGRGGELRLVVPEENASLRLTFEITGHDEVHAIYPSRSAALEAGR